jgi:ATP-binding cassette subfamily B protein
LDEATSALDEDSQKKVQDAFNKARKGRTMIVIAHRMSTIEGCDKLFMIQTGKVIESGTFTDLRNSDGAFAKMASKK